MNDYRRSIEADDPTLMKRQRVEGPVTIIGNSSTSSSLSSKPTIQINVTPSTPTPEQEKKRLEREKSKANILQIRFKKAMRINDSNMLLRCLDSGYKPNTLQWIQIIGKMHVTTALNCVKNAIFLEAPCISSAIRTT